MTQTAAAFKATYSDMRIIKGRKVVQLVFEIPTEGWHEASEVLGGIPEPHRDTWVAIARLNTAQSKEPPKKDWEDIPRAQQAGILASDKTFLKFINEQFGGGYDDAAPFVRKYCNIQSRAELSENQQSAVLWDKLVDKYRAWKLAPQAGAA